MSMPSSREDVATTQRSRPGFQVVLDQGPLVLGHRAVVGPGQHGIGAGGAAGLGHHVGRRRGRRRHGTPAGAHRRRSGQPARPSPASRAELVPAAAGRHQLPFGVDLVEPGRQPFGEPARVGEHDGGLVGQHQVHDLFLHVRPDRRLRLQPGGRTGIEGPGGALEIGHVLHRNGHGQVPVLPRRRRHDFHRSGTGQELRHELPGLHRGGEPDPLGGFGQQRVEAFQRYRQVGAALGAGDGVDLVHDDGVHLAERFPGLGGEHQEQGLRGGDEDVRRVAEQCAAVRRRRVPGPDADGDQRGGQAQPLGGLGDADQRRAEVAFDVDAQRLERGDVQHAGFPLGLPCGCRLPLGAAASQAGQLRGLGGCAPRPAAGPAPRGTPRGFCRNPWGPPPGRANRRRWRSRRRSGRAWARKTRPGTTPGWAG